MKAVVLETRDGLAVVLREDGVVEKLRREARVGETIEVGGAGKVLRFPGRATKWGAAAAAALIVLTAGGTYGYNNAYAYSYVTLDANPSIEYVLNRKNQVIAVTALNEDGAALAEELTDVKKQSLTYAIAETTEILYAREYLGEDKDNCVLISVSSRGEAQQEALSDEVDAYFSARQDEEGLTVYVTYADRGDRDKAEALGVSTGRYSVIRDIEAREDLTGDDLERLSHETVGGLLERSGAKTAGDRGRTDAPSPDRTEAGPASGEPAAEVGSARGAEAPGEGPGVPEQTGESPRGTEPSVSEEPGVPGDSLGAGGPQESGPGGSASGEPS